MVPINRPFLGPDEEQLVLKVLRSGQLTDATLMGGAMVKEFERSLTKYLGVADVVAVSSGTAALHVALMAFGIGPGDEVLIPSFTFAATANSVVAVGARPVFVDIDEYYTIDVEDARRKVTRRTKAIIPVHLYGHVADMDAIMELAEERSLIVIEDAAQALGSKLFGRPVGTIGHAGCFSFHPSKVVTTGEGGAISTNDAEIAMLCRMIRNHGMVKGYDTQRLGLNFRMSELHAAIGVAQMGKLEQFLKRRRENASRLRELLEGIEGIRLPEERPGAEYNWYLFTIASPKREKIREELERAGIGARVYYEIPVHRLPMFNSEERLPNTERAAEEVLSLPVHPGVGEEELEAMASAVKNALKT